MREKLVICAMDAPEYWLRGPVGGISPLLQPVAHALLQAREEVNVLMTGFPEERLWVRPAGLASAGFHLQHLSGVLDRLFTYADGRMLSEEQLAALAREGLPISGMREGIQEGMQKGLDRFNEQIDNALRQLGRISERDLTEVREVGRGRVPSTVIGLLFHAAEHTMRHTGQLLVTTRVLRGAGEAGCRDVAG
jgi:hypothetical protein